MYRFDMVINHALQQILNKMFMLGGGKIVNESNSQESVHKHISGAHHTLSHFSTSKNQLSL